MIVKYQSVAEYFAGNHQWQEGLHTLRDILSDTELDETLKWYFPVYTLKKKNVVGIGSFKDYFGLWFFQGVFLNDEAGLLVNAQDGKTKAMRQLRFYHPTDLDISLVRSYVEEAIANQKAGKEIKPTRTTRSVIVPEELQQLLAENELLQATFSALSLGKQREFCEYIAKAKRVDTKVRRLAEASELLRSGKTPADKYRK